MATLIVGGGLFGLALGFHLQRAGEAVRLLEAAASAGGVLSTVTEHGYTTESAANAFLDREPALTRLIDALGLADRVRAAEAGPAAARYVFTRGRLRRLPATPGAFLRSDVLPWWARLRVLLEPLCRRGAPGADESFATFMTRHVGERATRVLADAFQTGIWAGDVDALSAGAAFPRLAELERVHQSLLRGLRAERRRAPPHGSGRLCTLDGGMATLVSALAGRLGPALLLGHRAAALAREDGGWRVRCADGRELLAEQVVLAVPSPAAAALLGEHDRALEGELDAIRYAPIAVVHLGFEAPLAQVPDALGFLVPAEERQTVLGALFISRLFPWRAPGRELLTVLAGGERAQGAVDLSDAALVERVRSELGLALGALPAPSYLRIARWPRAIPQYNVGHLARLERIDGALRGLPGLHLAGSAYLGPGITDVARDAEALAARLRSTP